MSPATSPAPRPPGRARLPLPALRVALLALLWTALGTAGCGFGGSSGASKQGDGDTGAVAPVPTGAHAFVLAPEEIHYGGTYAQWSQRWWQWVFETPRAGHPLYDTTGADARTGQIDPVWFLGGIFTVYPTSTTGTVVRDITIPSGTALFFPIINAFATNTNCTPPASTDSFTTLRRICANSVVNVQNVLCEIDGVKVLDSPNLAGAKRFRAQAPAFSAHLTADNIFMDFCGGVPLPAQEMDLVASDGIWMMVGPMPTGAHTIHFAGTFPVPTFFQLDITYHITVQ